MGRSIFFLIGLLVVGTIYGCHETSPDNTVAGELSSYAQFVDRAETWAQQANARIQIRATTVDVDGAVHHISFLARGDGNMGRSQKLALLRDGQVVSAQEAERLFSERHVQKWGSASPELINAWSVADAMPVVLFLEDTSVFDSLAAQLPNSSLHLHENPFPFASASLTLPEWETIKHVKGLKYVVYAGEEFEDFSSPNPNSSGASHYSRSASRFNEQGYYAEDIKVGIIEASGLGCGIMAQHEAFSQNTVKHQVDMICQTDADCNYLGCEYAGFCRDSRCVKPHATWVASRISHTSQDQPNHAARAKLYVANRGMVIPDAQNPGAITLADRINALVDRYEWLVRERVFIVNQSWGPVDRYYAGVPNVRETFQDSLSEYYSRHAGMTITKAAGNDGNTPNKETACHSLNSICVGSTDANGTIYDSVEQYLDDVMDPVSNYLNPYTFYSSNPFNPMQHSRDLERPDVVSQGRESVVAMIANDELEDPGREAWRDTQIASANLLDGTSFAAPIVAGTLALLQECRETVLLPIHNKVLIRNSASVAQNLEASNPHTSSSVPTPPFYPTPGETIADPSNYDSLAGAGIHHAAGLSCGRDDCPEDVECGDGTTTIELDEGEELHPLLSEMPQGETVLLGNDIVEQQSFLSKPHSTNANVSQKSIAQLGAVPEGSRIRVDLSWLACSPHDRDGSTALLGDVFDFDLALCDVTSSGGSGCAMFSESFDDSNEGFDIVTTTSYDELEIIVIWESQRFDGSAWVQNTDCDGSIRPTVAWAYRWRSL